MSNSVKVISVNIGSERGRKYPVHEIILNEQGILGDSNYAKGSRQITMLSMDQISRFNDITMEGRTSYGEFDENITIDSFEGIHLKPFDRFTLGDVELEVTHIGEKPMDKFEFLCDYLMPFAGVSLRVAKPGIIKTGDKLKFEPKVFKIKVIVLSDRASWGVYTDRSGKRIIELVNGYFSSLGREVKTDYSLLPDDMNQLNNTVTQTVFDHFDVIFTSGGTGIGPRDITIETIRPMLTKEIPGIMESIRFKSGLGKPSALLSCGVAGLIGKTLVYTLPGSVSAVEEYLTEIFKSLNHAIFTVHGIDNH